MPGEADNESAPDRSASIEEAQQEQTAGSLKDYVERSALEEQQSEPEGRPVREVYGSARNIGEIGSPIARSKTERLRYYFYPTWRSQFLNFIWFAVSSLLSIVVTQNGPSWLVVRGSLFTWGETTLYLDLPLLVLVPGYVLGKIFITVFDAKYIVDDGGIEAQIGLVSLNLRQPRLRWEDIRGSEPQQTIWERILGIGSVLVGSAMTQDVEIVMSGVPSPKTIQLLIQNERERRMQELRQMSGGERVLAAHAD